MAVTFERVRSTPWGDGRRPTHPDSGKVTYTYDSLGRELSHTDARGDVTSFTYDALGRVQSKTLLAGTPSATTATWTYDEGREGFANVGRLTSVSDQAGRAMVNYNAAGLSVQLTRQTGGQTFATSRGYDAGGRLTSEEFTRSRRRRHDDVHLRRCRPRVFDPRRRHQRDLRRIGEARLSPGRQRRGPRLALTRRAACSRPSRPPRGPRRCRNLTYARDNAGKVSSVTRVRSTTRRGPARIRHAEPTRIGRGRRRRAEQPDALLRLDRQPALGDGREARSRTTRRRAPRNRTPFNR